MSSSLTLSQTHQLKDIPIGEVMVIRPYDYFSLAVVTKATEPFRTGVQLGTATNRLDLARCLL